MARKAAFFVFSFLLAIIFSTQNGFAGEREKAIAFGDQAAAYYKANGEKKFGEAVNVKGMFKEGELYAWALKTDFSTIASAFAHPSAALRDKNFIDLKDANGKSFIREILKVAQEKGTGWLDYMWTEPVSKKIKPKHTYIIRVNDVIILSGYYD
ncbi:MAG TPA: cache domain-containing protein [Spirochaetota bacterium]|nr:cache domain-containing protein [Spirochaetota bacterium]HRZ26452.1 cache domain-containing protein [Spirochaetota bacterium]HSA16325.1 cache domain-containing protein [Spirochaetota bacterium]